MSRLWRFLLCFGISVLGAVAVADERSSRAIGSMLAEQLAVWHARSGKPELPASTLLAGIAGWTRLHGVLSLELDGHLHATGVDPALIYRAEVDALLV